jgi:hypothetical protein
MSEKLSSIDTLLNEITKAIQTGVEKLPVAVDLLVNDFGRYKLFSVIGDSIIAFVLLISSLIFGYFMIKCSKSEDSDMEGIGILCGFISFFCVVGLVVTLFIISSNLAAAFAPYGYLLNHSIQ